MFTDKSQYWLPGPRCMPLKGFDESCQEVGQTEGLTVGRQLSGQRYGGPRHALEKFVVSPINPRK